MQRKKKNALGFRNDNNPETQTTSTCYLGIITHRRRMVNNSPNSARSFTENIKATWISCKPI
jgi:hypothetical protein